MFVMKPDPEFTVTAEGRMPGENGEPFSFRPTFVALSSTDQATYDMATEAGTLSFLRRTLVGLDDVVGADDKPVPFNDDTREWLLDQIHTRGALVRAYFAGVYGAQLGN